MIAATSISRYQMESDNKTHVSQDEAAVSRHDIIARLSKLYCDPELFPIPTAREEVLRNAHLWNHIVAAVMSDDQR